MTIEVSTNGRIFIYCGKQRGEHRFPKRNGKTHSEGYAILVRLAAKPELKNPRSWEEKHDAERRRFYRLEKDLSALLPLPDRPFKKEGRSWKPVFKIGYHKSMTESVQAASARNCEQDEVDYFLPVEGAFHDCHQ